VEKSLVENSDRGRLYGSTGLLNFLNKELHMVLQNKHKIANIKISDSEQYNDCAK
jgi:hypothetical protein